MPNKIKIESRPLTHPYLTADMPDLLKRIYAGRGIQSLDELNFNLASLIPFNQLNNTDKAANRLFTALKQQQRITIVGDFDADGATSTALAIKALQAFGFQFIDYLVPSRFKDGYGLSKGVVDIAHQQQNPDLIITVDNGISSIEGVAQANQYQIDVLVTDHHLAGQQLPQACVIVNPNMPNDSFPSKALAGVGVIFYVMLALRSLLREQNWFINHPEPNMAELLDLVALGTVADVVSLDQNNRILVSQGMRRIKAGVCCAGITALLEVAGRNPTNLATSDLGFAVAPRLNAAGRLESMSLGIDCLLETDSNTAREYALQLQDLNKERQEIEQQMRQEAIKYIEYLEINQQKELPLGLCLYSRDWHQGVIGIVASRIKDRHHRPVVAFATGDKDQIKGSCRSIQGVHIRDVLERIANQNPNLIIKFGGHAMAAGLTLLEKNYATFEQQFDKVVREYIDPTALEAKLMTDGHLQPAEMTIQMATLLRDAAPWGQHFPAPLFEGCFKVIKQHILASKHIKLVLKPLDYDLWIDAIAFNQAEDLSNDLDQIRIVYKMDINEYRGNIKLQLIIDYIEPII